MDRKFDGQLYTEENSISKEEMIKLWKEYFEKKTERDYLSLFIKIPFCVNRCQYCMYFSDIYKNVEQVDDYLDKLELQIKEYSKLFKNQIFHSMYVGGGTPSILNIYQIKRLLSLVEDNFNLDKNNNIFSFETSISTLTEDKIDILVGSNLINRISIGIQTLSPQILDLEERKNPDIDKIYEKLEYVVNAFKKKHIINVDLMAGLKNQDKNILIGDFKFLSDLNVPKITVYSKKVYSKHDDDGDNLLRDIRIKYIEDLLGYVSHENKYDFEKEITNEYFYNFCRKDHDFTFNKIYLDRPVNIDGMLNSTLGIGKLSSSWQGLDSFYQQGDLNKYYHNNTFYWLQESMKENYKVYPFSNLRKILYS